MDDFPLPKTLTKIDGKGPHAVFAIEPLYPGYGTTIGNALRRVLLSSLPGAAITHVKVNGVTHEFSSLPYVKEDVVDILLNIKQIRLRQHQDEPVVLILKATGASSVTAGDIQPNAGAEVVNPEQVVATLTDKAANIDLELTVQRGRGYVPVENREKERLEIGTIAVDAIYTPVKNVNFTTEHVRVEQITNYDKLILEITTDGTISPDEALRQSALIMVDHFQFTLDQITASAAEAEATNSTVTAKPKKRTIKKKTESEGE